MHVLFLFIYIISKKKILIRILKKKLFFYYAFLSKADQLALANI